jgi:hypothetical protein
MIESGMISNKVKHLAICTILESKGYSYMPHEYRNKWY